MGCPRYLAAGYEESNLAAVPNKNKCEFGVAAIRSPRSQSVAPDEVGLLVLVGFQQPQRMETVDRADERRVDAVAEHSANVIGDCSSDFTRNRQREGLHRSQPRL